MSNNRIRLMILAGTLTVLLFVLGITGWLNVASFKKNYTESLMAGYTVVGNEPVRKIEYALKYGKPLYNFFGIENLLKEAKKDSPEIKNIRVILNNGAIVYDLNGKVENQSLPDKLLREIKFGPGNENTANITVLNAGEYHNFLPIKDRNNKWLGELDLIFNQSIVNANVKLYTMQTARYGAVMAVIAALLMAVLIFMVRVTDELGQINKARFLAIVLIIIGIIQLAFGYLSFNMFKQSYTNVARQSIAKMAVIVQKDINMVVDKGVSYGELYGIEGWFKKIVKSAPEIEQIYLSGNGRDVIYATDTAKASAPALKDYMYNLPLKHDSSGLGANIHIALSKKYIDNKVFNIALDMLTVLVTSFFFMVEVTILMAVFIDRQIGKIKQPKQVADIQDVRIIRPLAFVFYYSAFMSISFIPTLMKSFYKPIFGLPENVVLGLPISVELLFGGLAIIFAGYMIGSKGWKPVFFTGLALFEVGALLSGMARGPVSFIVSRAVFGLGYGCSLMALQGFVNSAKLEESKREGMSALGSGTYAGINCACVIGAMLAERIGFSQVFFVTFTIAAVAGIFALVFIPNARIAAASSKSESPVSSGSVAGFFSNRNIFSFFLFIVIPVAIGSMFLEFFLPVFAKNAGISSANVGRVFLLNGLAVVYLGPLISKYLAKSLGAKKSVALAALTMSVAFLVFALQGSILAALFTAFLLGLADGFGSPAQNGYLLNLDATKALGEGKALGFYSVVIKAGQVLGPLLFGLAMSMGPADGVGIVGIFIIAAIALFLLLSKFHGNNKSNSFKTNF